MDSLIIKSFQIITLKVNKWNVFLTYIEGNELTFKFHWEKLFSLGVDWKKNWSQKLKKIILDKIELTPLIMKND